MTTLIACGYVAGALLSARWLYGKTRARHIDGYVTQDKCSAGAAVRRFERLERNSSIIGALLLGAVWPLTWTGALIVAFTVNSKVRSRAEKAADLHGDSVG